MNENERFSDYIVLFSHINDLFFAGLLAISLVLLPIYFAMGMLDRTAFISLISLAIAIPALGGCLIVKTIFGAHLARPSLKKMFAFAALADIAILFDFIGIVSAFWHLSWIAGVIFLISTALIFGVVYFVFYRQIKS